MKIVDQSLIQNIESLIENSEYIKIMPVLKEDTISVSFFEIKKNSDEFYQVRDSRTDKVICHTFSQIAAVAIATQRSKKYGIDSKIIMDLDNIISKNYNDIIYFKNAIKNCSDTTKKQVILTRHKISVEKILNAKEKLVNIIKLR